MAIAFDNASPAAYATSAANVTSTAYTVAGSSRYKVGFGGMSGTGPTAATNLKWGGSGGVGFTALHAGLAVGTFSNLRLFGLVAPAAANQTLYGDWAVAKDEITIGGVSYTGVDQSTSLRNSGVPTTNTGTLSGASTSCSVTVSTQAGDLVVAAFFAEESTFHNPTFSAGAGTTLRQNNNGSSPDLAACIAEAVATGTSTTITVNCAGSPSLSGSWGGIAVALIPASSATGGIAAPPRRLYPTSPGRGPVLNAFRGSTQQQTGTTGVLMGPALGTGIAAALLAGAGALSGAAFGTGIAQANITGTGALSAAAEGTSVAQGQGLLYVIGSGAALGTGIAQADLAGTANCTGAAIGTAVAQSLLTGSGALAGSALGTAIVQGLVADSGSVVAFTGAALGTGVGQAALTATGTLTGAPMGTGLAQALLTATATLNGAAIGTGIAQALLIDAASLSAIPGAAVGTSIAVGFIEDAPQQIIRRGGGRPRWYRYAEEKVPSQYKRLEEMVDEVAQAYLNLIETAPASIVEKAAQVVRPYTDVQDEIPAVAAIDWASLESDSRKVGRLISLWVAEQNRQRRIRDDDEWFLLGD